MICKLPGGRAKSQLFISRPHTQLQLLTLVSFCCTLFFVLIMQASDIYQFLPSQSVKSLRRISDFISKLIDIKTPIEREFVSSINPDDFIKYHQSFITDSECDRLLQDLRPSIELNSTVNNKTRSVWFTNSEVPYTWNSVRSGGVTRKQPVKIGSDSAIASVMNRINQHLGTSLNACLVQFYPNEQSGVRLHDDLEPEMTHGDPIAVISVGSERKVEFLHNYQSPSGPPIRSLVPASGSLYVMDSGTQDFFRHRVPAVKVCSGMRASFSFRRVVGPTMHDLLAQAKGKIIENQAGTLLVLDDTLQGDTSSVSEPNRSLLSIVSEHATTQNVLVGPNIESSPISGSQDHTPEQHSLDYRQSSDVSSGNRCRSTFPRMKTVLFGSSMTKYINEHRLSNSRRQFINVSRSGARLSAKNRQPWVYKEMLEDFVASNMPELSQVDRVIFSVGTNDLRFFRDRFGNPGNLRTLISPVEELITLTRRHFGPDVKIYFHSVLPMRCLYTYTAANFEGFNRLLRDICSYNGCYFVDWFNCFLNYQGNDINSSLYWDNIHLNNQGSNVLHDLLNDLNYNHFSCYSNVY